MPISLTCVCGAILEIDDKFKGRKVPCPDCNRLLNTVAALPPPQATSGWALASLVASLAGMLTFVGPLIGIACGILGLRQIARDPKLGGTQFARAGIISGAIFAAVSVWALIGTEFLGLDGFVRLVSQTHDLKFPADLVVRSHKLANGEIVIRLKRPSLAWGVKQVSNTDTPDDLTLVSAWDDAHILVFSLTEDKENKADDYRRDAINAFLKSGLVKMLTRNVEPAFPLPAQIKIISEDEKDPVPQSFRVDFTWDTGPRAFLFHIGPLEVGNNRRLNVAVGGTRLNRFDRLEEPIRQALESCELEKQN